MDDATLISQIRAFNRAYTNRLGLIGRDFLDSPYSLTEARILHEIGVSGAGTTAAALCATLSLDPAYFSRLLKGLRARGLVDSAPAPEDRRSFILRLSDKGMAEYHALAERSNAQIAGELARMTPEDRHRLGRAVATLRELFDPDAAAPARPPAIIRPYRSGDIGWLIETQAVAYQRDHGFNHRFEGLVAQITGDFLSRAPAPREACWIAEAGGERLGSIMVTEGDAETAKLRLLFVEARARGLGLGRALVQTVIDFAKVQGYRHITLWTNAELKPALTLYESCGFRLVAQEPYGLFGTPSMSQTWCLDLRDPSPLPDQTTHTECATMSAD